MTITPDSCLPPLSDLFRRYSRELALIILPSAISIILAQFLHHKDLTVAYFVLIPVFIGMWIFKIGLMLHIVDHQLEAASLKTLFSSGAAFWPTMFRANLLLGAAGLAIFVPLVLIGNALNVKYHAVAQLITALVLLKWNLLLEPLLYRNRGFVFDAWKTAWKIRLPEMKNLVLLFIFAVFVAAVPYRQIHALVAIMMGMVSILLSLMIDLAALRFICRNNLAPLKHIRVSI